MIFQHVVGFNFFKVDLWAEVVFWSAHNESWSSGEDEISIEWISYETPPPHKKKKKKKRNGYSRNVSRKLKVDLRPS